MVHVQANHVHARLMLLAVAACKTTLAPVSPTPADDGSCPAPARLQSMGCEAERTFPEGCYVSCDVGACADGFTCTSMMVAPGGSDAAEVCATEEMLCIPDR